MDKLAHAIELYQHAKATDDCEAWKQAAIALYAVRQKPRKPRAVKPAKRRPYKPRAGKYGRKLVAQAVFADGRVAEASFWSAADKPTDWERAERNCRRAYQFWTASQQNSGEPWRRVTACIECHSVNAKLDSYFGRQSDGPYTPIRYEFTPDNFWQRRDALPVPAILRINELKTGEFVTFDNVVPLQKAA